MMDILSEKKPSPVSEIVEKTNSLKPQWHLNRRLNKSESFEVSKRRSADETEMKKATKQSESIVLLEAVL